MFRRHIEPKVREALTDTPVVLVVGPRQAGKSTLVSTIASTTARRVLTLDDAPVLAAARADPVGFVAGLQGDVALDEVQRAPELLLAIKASVDRDRRPGRFLLTGSANVLTLPRVADALTGRIDVHTLWPLSEAEIEGSPGDAVERLFAAGPLAPREARGGPWEPRALASGYPEARTRTSTRRSAWFASYVATVLSRDVRDVADVEGLVHLPRLLALLASRVTGLLNEADLGRTLGLPHTTLRRYLSLVETLFLVAPVPAWFINTAKRLAKAPRMHFGDAGLVCHLLDLTSVDELRGSAARGPVLETFVQAELRKQVEAASMRARLLHLRAHTGQEVDLVVEGPKGRIVGVEVKASASVGASDFAGLRALASLAGEAFHRGVVVYGGSEVIPFGENLHAVPVSWLWS